MVVVTSYTTKTPSDTTMLCTLHVRCAKAKRSRKYWLGCNWKCNGSIDFIKDSVQNLFNDV